MHKVEIKVEGTKILVIQPGFRLLEKGIRFVEFTHSMLNGTHEMHRHIEPIMAKIVPIVVPHIDVTSSVTIEPFRFRVKPIEKEVWDELLPAIIGIIQQNVTDKVGVKVIGRDQWPMWILGKKRR